MRTLMVSYLVVFVAFATSSYAGPDKTTQSLMDEAVSLLDWGIFRIGDRLSQKHKGPGGWVEYEYESNTIVIRSYAEGKSSNQSLEVLNSFCEEWINDVRRTALINPESGNPFWGSTSGFARMFTHEGYIWGEHEDNEARLKDLDKKFVLEFSVRDTSYKTLVECNTPLLGSGFSTKDNR